MAALQTKSNIHSIGTTATNDTEKGSAEQGQTRATQHALCPGTVMWNSQNTLTN